MDNSLQPKYPTFPDELVERCKKSRDFRPILFEWYKYVGMLCNTIARISPTSPAMKKEVSPVHFAVLIGLLNRCSRLMLANTRLSSTRKYGETTRLIDRSISESAIKVQWLCQKNCDDRFFRYLADGQKQDLVLKEEIERNIHARHGSILVIEQRMLDSIQNCQVSSGLSEQDIRSAKKLPDFATMCNDLEYDDGIYTAVQRMGSHAVHGTWSELVFDYLKEENHRYYPRDHEVETQDVQFIIIIHLVLDAIESFLRYVITDDPERDEIITTLHEIDNKIRDIQHLAWSPNFSPI